MDSVSVIADCSSNASQRASDHYAAGFHKFCPTAPADQPGPTVLASLREALTPVIKQRLTDRWTAQTYGAVTVFNENINATAEPDSVTAEVKISAVCKTTIQSDIYGRVLEYPETVMDPVTIQASATATFDVGTQSWTVQ